MKNSRDGFGMSLCRLSAAVPLQRMHSRIGDIDIGMHVFCMRRLSSGSFAKPVTRKIYLRYFFITVVFAVARRALTPRWDQ